MHLGKWQKSFWHTNEEIFYWSMQFYYHVQVGASKFSYYEVHFYVNFSLLYSNASSWSSLLPCRTFVLSWRNWFQNNRFLLLVMIAFTYTINLIFSYFVTHARRSIGCILDIDCCFGVLLVQHNSTMSI